MEKTSSPHPAGYAYDVASPRAVDPDARRLKETMLLCMSSICVVCVLCREAPMDAETRMFADLSLLCVSIGAICATLVFVRSSITRSMCHSQGAAEVIKSRWQRWMTFPVPMLWATCAVVLLIPAALSHFYGFPIPRVSSAHVRTIATSTQVLGIVCIGSILVSFRRYWKRSY